MEEEQVLKLIQENMASLQQKNQELESKKAELQVEMLAQRDISCKEKLRPVAFYHHALSKREQKYSATEKELLAVILAVKKFRVYLGKRFDLITDHHALKWLRSLDPENETCRHGKWIDYLQRFDMNIIHMKGKSPEMKIADYLSRVISNGDVLGNHPNNTVNVIGKGDPEHPVLISKEEILKRQKSDEDIRDVMKALADGKDLNPGGSNSNNWRKRSLSSKGEVKELWKHKDRLYIDGEGILRLRFNGGRVNEENPFGIMEKNRIVVPESYRSEIMKLVHRSAKTGHMG